jgi:hypothetical protein
MKRFIIALALAGLLTNDPFSLWTQTKTLLAQQNSPSYSLQVASLPTKISAQKEVDRLKSFNIQAQFLPWDDSSNKTWFRIYIEGFQTKKDATLFGNQLIQKGLIHTFKVSLKKNKEETSPKVEEQPLPSSIYIKKEPFPIPGNSPVYVGPIFSEETGEEGLRSVQEGPPLSSNTFNLQVASYYTLAAAQKELKRLKSYNIEAKYLLRKNQSKKKLFVIYLDRFKSQEAATREGNQLVQRNIITKFNVFTPKGKEETLSTQVKESPSALPMKAPQSPPTQTTKAKENPPALKTKAREGPPAPITPAKKEPSLSAEKNPVYFGPISIREEEKSLSINIVLDQKIFPEISADKTSEGSRLMVTFKNIDGHIVPVDFNKFQSKTLISFSLAQKGTDCTIIILLSSTFNYEVAQNYFEKEKLYSLLIGKQ